MKKWIVFILAMIMATALVACGDHSEPAPKPEEMNALVPESEQPESEQAAYEENVLPETSEITEEPVKIVHPIVIHEQMACTKPEDWESGVNCEFDVFALTDQDAEEYPRLAKALLKSRSDKELQGQAAFSGMQEFMVSYYADVGPEDENIFNFSAAEDKTKCQVVRSDSVAFSVFCDYLSSSGATMPYYWYSGMNYDTKTGHMLSCEDIVKDVDRFNAILVEKLMEDYGTKCGLEEDNIREYLAQCKAGLEEYVWLLGHEGITVYFNPHTLFSINGGMQIVTIRFADHPEIFEEAYTRVPENYIEPFCGSEKICTDVDGDGKLEAISATAVPADNDEDRLLVFIDIDDVSTTFSYPEAMSGALYLVHMNGRCFIYNFVDGIDYSDLIVCYDLSDGTVKESSRYDQGSSVIVDSNYYDLTEQSGIPDVSVFEIIRADEVFVDPVNFRLTYWFDALSTCSGVVECSIGADGLPVKNSQIYNVSKDWLLNKDFPASFSFTTKLELTMHTLDADGNAAEEILIPAGTELIYLRTDAKTFADFRLENGSEVRAPIYCQTYPQQICNETVEDALAGTLYLG